MLDENLNGAAGCRTSRGGGDGSTTARGAHDRDGGRVWPAAAPGRHAVLADAPAVVDLPRAQGDRLGAAAMARHLARRRDPLALEQPGGDRAAPVDRRRGRGPERPARPFWPAAD